jgi:3-deoxy-7-phosphoheptulonate synthase
LIIILKAESNLAERSEFKEYLSKSGVKYKESDLDGIPVFHIIENAYLLDARIAEDFSAVYKTVRLTSSSPLAVKDRGCKKRVITVNGVAIGGMELAVIAGPCSVESYDQLKETAVRLKKAGIKILRAGAFKPRTSPYSFQGMGESGIEVLGAVREETGMAVVTEILDTRDLETITAIADIFQVGMRNMRNYPLLKELGKTGKPVLLKRAMDSSVEEWLLSAEYILKEGNEKVILCERGVLNPSACGKRTIMDLNGALEAMDRTNLPLIVDPSHASGERSKVAPLAKAAVVAGADGLMIEVHPRPAWALSDGFQALYLEEFEVLLVDLMKLKEFMKSQVQ